MGSDTIYLQNPPKRCGLRCVTRTLACDRRVVLRPARAAELPALLRINVAADAHEHRLVPDVAGRRIDRRRALHYWKSALRCPRAAVLVAARGRELLGVIGVDLVVARSRLAPVRRHVYLHSLWVEPASRRLGLGRALAQSALAWGARRGATQARLEMASANAGARRLYAGLGFAEREVMMARPI